MIDKKTVGAAASKILDAGYRRWVLLANLGSATVFVAWDGSNDVTGSAGNKPGYPLYAGTAISQQGGAEKGAPDPAVYAITDSGTSNVAVQTY
jgi:hypothetical protein